LPPSFAAFIHFPDADVTANACLYFSPTPIAVADALLPPATPAPSPDAHYLATPPRLLRVAFD